MKNHHKASVGVFCSSKDEMPTPFLEFAYQFGSFLGEKGFQAIYGGGTKGMIRQFAEGVSSANGEIVGITTKFYKETEGPNKIISERIICDTLSERKKLLIEKSDVLCYLPGGFGTLDELMTGIHFNKETKLPKPIIIVDLMNYFSPFLNWLEEISIMNAIQNPSEHFCIARSMNDLEKILAFPNL